MGMKSYFDDEDIEVLDFEGVKSVVNTFKKAYPDSIFEEMIKGKKFSFETWDDIKLISYWYDEELLFLECIAPYINGQVYWTFENQDETGSVTFENGKCVITTGQMDYHEWNPKEQIRREIPQEIKKQLILGNLDENKR